MGDMYGSVGEKARGKEIARVCITVGQPHSRDWGSTFAPCESAPLFVMFLIRTFVHSLTDTLAEC